MTPVLAFDLSAQVVFSGAVTGITYGIMAVGVILIYRSARVINFAIAEMGGFAAALCAFLVINVGVGYWVAFAASVAVGALVGCAMELLVVRRLFDAPRVILLVATIGAAQLLLFAQSVLPDLEFVRTYPTPFSKSWSIGDVLVRSEHVVVLVTMSVATLALAIFLGRTKVGTAIRAAAANPSAARLAGISVRRMSTLVWTLAGALSALATILAAPFTTSVASEIFTLGPGLLVRVLAAALIARMTSLPIALVAGMAIGATESVVFHNNPTERGLIDLALLVVVIASLLLLARGQSPPRPESWSFAPRVRPTPPELQRFWLVRNLPRLGVVCAVLLALVPLVFLERPSQHFVWSRVLLYALAALSLTVLTGWAGQLSLSQMAFAGLGAMTAAALVREGVGPGPALALAALVGAVAAVLVGAPALRRPGLFLAVSTLAFAVAASSWLLSRSLFLEGRANAVLPRLIVGSVSLQSQRTYYAVCLVALVATMYVVSRLRRSGIGRTFVAVRDNERAIASFGLSPARVKLTAFAVSGAIAGMAGGLLAGLLVTFPPARFSATESLRLVSIAVIGGLASVTGTVLGAVWVVGLPALFPDSPTMPLLTSGAGLLILLLYFPGGLVQVLYNLRDAIFGMIAKRQPAVTPTEERRAPVATSHLPLRPVPSSSGDVALRVGELTVAFGSRVVVDGVSLHVGHGEVVGLIGANGAGKSTLMNAVGGFVPSGGTIELFGREVDRLAPARRARLGLGRTFQGAELFGDLTVRETVQVALERRGRAPLLSVAIGLPRARRLERAKRVEADEVIAFLGLGRFADRFVNELSTGTRRIVELACLIASGARVLCLDEPTAGIAQRESEAFGPLLLRIRQELDASILVIEHDMPVVMGISNRIYCLEAGTIIAEGTPDAVRNDPLVIASYLGTDATAINRSGKTVTGVT